ncbi:MAG: hypothetical protein PUH39_06195, partial [Bacteroidales bacterium]|nr:hypothetical protein [Bacteroidales bacterium]
GGQPKNNYSSLHNNGCPKLSCVVVNEHDNIDNQRTTIHHSLIMVVPSCPALSSINTTTLTTKDNNSSLLNYGCPKLSCVVVIKKEMA